MYLIDCPHCGLRAQLEFTYERTMDSIAPAGAEPEEAMRVLYNRANPMGADDEVWRHTYGCRAWLVLTRNRVTHSIDAVRAVGPETLA